MAHGDYETDIVGWSEDQAARLRRIAAGERPNDVGAVDWPNLIEEIEDVGKRERRAVMSHLQVALLHVLKAYAWPDHQDRRHWLSEANTALANMRRAVDPGMRQRLDLAEAYADARESVKLEQMDGRGPPPLPRDPARLRRHRPESSPRHAGTARPRRRGPRRRGARGRRAVKALLQRELG